MPAAGIVQKLVTQTVSGKVYKSTNATLTGTCANVTVTLASTQGTYSGMNFVPNYKKQVTATGDLGTGCSYSFGASASVPKNTELRVSALYQGTYGSAAPAITSAESAAFTVAAGQSVTKNLTLYAQYIN